jgi:cellobiose phosphorylase
VFFAGEPDTALTYLQKLSRRRLLGDHVPYVVEAFPEGNGRHLSAESALYCRVVTEGMFGITPTGFKSFTVKPSLPKAWDKMALRKVKAFKSTFDVEVKRDGGKLKLIVSPKGGKVQEFSIKPGESVAVKL